MAKLRRMDKELAAYDNQIHAMATTLAARANLLSTVGIQYGGKRDMYTVLGYPTNSELTFANLYERYRRQDIAQAIINKPVDYSWRGQLKLTDTEDGEDNSAFEKAWEELEKKHHLKNRFVKADKLAGIGRYSIILLGFDGVKTQGDWTMPVLKGRKLQYIKQYGEGSVSINTYETDPSNERYGKPLTYNVLTAPYESDAESKTIVVHHTRVIHIVEQTLVSDTYGDGRLIPVINRLFDLEKLVGGSGEMFWRGARPGYSANVDKEFTMGAGDEDRMQQQIEEYENDIRRMLAIKGVNIQSLAQQVEDPSQHVDVVIQMISANTNIPKRLLTGSERGELSSAQDSDEWKSYIKSRREDFVEKQILRPFVDKLIEYGALPKPQGGDYNYEIQWEDLFAQSEKEKSDIGKTRSAALKEYSANAIAQTIVPPRQFFKHFLGFSDAVLNELDDGTMEQMLAEEREAQRFEEEQARIAQEAQQASEGGDNAGNDNEIEE